MSAWKTRKTPVWEQRCPVCEGHGIVPHGFYSYPAGQGFSDTSTSPEQCRRCQGLGTIRIGPIRVKPTPSDPNPGGEDG